jgi:hypothetical protein
MSGRAGAGYPPKVIWILWLQGWDNAPAIAQASRASWTNRNPGWCVQALDRSCLTRFLPAADVARMLELDQPAEALSDMIRLELLDRYGGVWADATTNCARPLDDWLAQAMPQGFAALSRPGPDRMISTWFLAAEKGSEIVERWRAATHAYWQDRKERGSYFWVHELFAECHAEESGFRRLWDACPTIPAANPFHFGPAALRLKEAPQDGIEAALADPPVPVFKLTHKFASTPGPGSLFARLCAFATQPPERPTQDGAQDTERGGGRPVLVAWYGIFASHGTLGDLRSLEAVASHLVALGHDVLRATAAPLTIPGARRVDWAGIAPQDVQAVIFFCGPILRQHPLTQAFFRHFASARVAGVGVSLMPQGHENHVDPFDFVLARQVGGEMYGDVAVVAPLPNAVPRRGIPARDRAGDRLVVGLALRGAQQEYGASLCRDREAEGLFRALTERLGRDRKLEFVTLENHLLRSGREPDAIEAQYRDCDLVLTTRFHGAVTALRAEVPFLAIDQISGSAKVFPLLSPLGWPGLFRIDEATVEAVVGTGLRLVEEDLAAEVTEARSVARRDANRTLHRLGEWLVGLSRDHIPDSMTKGELA